MPAQPVGSVNVSVNELNSLADILVSFGVLDQKKAEEVKLTEIQQGTSQEELLKKLNIVSEEDLVKAKAKLYNIDYFSLDTFPVSPEAMATLPQEVAEKFKVFPVSIDKKLGQIVIAMADPMNLTTIEFIEQKTGLSVKANISSLSKIEDLISTKYSTSLSKEVTSALKDVSTDKDRIKTLNGSKTGFIREEKIAEIVSHILEFAVRARASDVHIEPQEKSTRVRYRIDGILQEKLTIPKELHDALISRIKLKL